MDALSWMAMIGTAAGILFLIWISIQGNPERDEEEAARTFFDEHGHWPDEPAPGTRA